MIEDEMRVDCATEFSRLTTTLDNTNRSIEKMTQSVDRLEARVGQSEIQMAKVASSTSSAWHELNDISTELKKVPGMFRTHMRDHQDDCVARSNATKSQQDQLLKPNTKLLKWIIYIGLGLGSLGIGAAGAIASLWDSDASAKTTK